MTHYADSNDEIARRLEAYAHARLSPNPDAVARMRGRVMAAVAASATRGTPVVASATDATAAADTPVARIVPFRQLRLGRPPRTLTALLAATLSMLLLSGVAAAGTAGGPLYGVRIWIESASLPSQADARADAELDRLEARIDDALRAAGSGNGRGVNAALAAYDEILTDALDAASRGELDHTERLIVALNHHRAVLIDLLGRVPEQARDAIARAIERSSRATPGAGHGTHGSNGRGNGGVNGNGGGNGNGGKPETRPAPKGGPQSGPQSRSGPGR